MACELSHANCTRPGGGCRNVNVREAPDPLMPVAGLALIKRSPGSILVIEAFHVIVTCERVLTLLPGRGSRR
jgi:hypothetical protein